ncbi:hypothetical protein [Bacillus glycinifermentans]|uniref:hypothetical protein n=1 Tax=Bacillus glycinifermentans TaxID=1664069 RepID=UPI001FF335F1|nr:hypothetical protein [Bacillus glycinifermentans]MEC3606693.1 hypothetical protein [Bacillus glycinifermentans]UOY88626.1 hypothetical protein MW696_21955 [Bacillus glycinifermentans]
MKKFYKRLLYGSVFLCIIGGIIAGFLEEGMKKGDELKLGTSIYGADTIDNWKEAKKKGRFTVFNEDGVTIKSIPRYQRVKIVKLINKEDMALLQILDGAYKGTKWWVNKSDIKKEKSTTGSHTHKYRKTSHSHHH